MRQSAFQPGGITIKTALHCHTTRSDGQMEPDALLHYYLEHGYGAVALTDHNVYNYHDYGVPDVLVLPGTERDFNIEGAQRHCVHTFHTVLLGQTKADGNPYAQDQRFENPKSVKDQDEFQPYLDQIHADGQMTFYCHPQWSGTPCREFDRMRGHFAMEIWNSGCAIENDMDTNAAYWDEWLMQGARVYGVAVDDGHPKAHVAHGWVNVNAKAKTVAAVLDALKNGAFYSSCGPVIEDFTVKDGVARLACSPCASVGFVLGGAPTRLKRDAAASLTAFETPVQEVFFRSRSYVRGVCQDAQGRRAWTNPIWLDDR